MSFLQIISLILFFYVFGLAAVWLTYYIVKTIRQLIQASQEKDKEEV